MYCSGSFYFVLFHCVKSRGSGSNGQKSAMHASIHICALWNARAPWFERFAYVFRIRIEKSSKLCFENLQVLLKWNKLQPFENIIPHTFPGFLPSSLGLTSANVDQREAYFNGSSYMRLLNPIAMRKHTAFSIRSCRGNWFNL